MRWCWCGWCRAVLYCNVLYFTVLYCTVLQGWQETTDAALTFLLRTALAKPGRENQGATPITLEPAKETTRWSIT